MRLVIDIGNTNITLGLYQGRSLGSRWRLATDHERMPDEYGFQILGLLQHGDCELSELEGICLSSVVPTLTGRIVQACNQYLGYDPLIVTHTLKTGVIILYENPAGVGADRIADAVAVVHLYGGGPACVVDFGTATTFNAITENNEYLGGAISPGIYIAANALFTRTSQLPRVDLKKPPSIIGQNTIHAIQSGLVFGYVSLVEGMITRFQKELGDKMKVIATGGLADLIAPETKFIQITDPWLTLNGLNIIWELNK